MTAAQLLSSQGVSMQQASDWVQTRLNKPGEIYSVCLEFGINSSMLAEIVQPFVPGVAARDVEAFFSNLGFNALALRHAGPLEPAPMPSPAPVPLPGVPAFADWAGEFSPFLSLVSLNNNLGILSTSSLREASLAQMATDSAYWALFNPANFGAREDGTGTLSEMGFTVLGNLPATSQTLESLFYGTAIRLVRSLDEQEANQLAAFEEANATLLQAGHAPTVNSLIQQLAQAFSTPAAVPLISDQDLAQILPIATAATVQLTGLGSDNYFEGLFSLGFY